MQAMMHVMDEMMVTPRRRGEYGAPGHCPRAEEPPLGPADAAPGGHPLLSPGTASSATPMGGADAPVDVWVGGTSFRTIRRIVDAVPDLAHGPWLPSCPDAPMSPTRSSRSARAPQLVPQYALPDMCPRVFVHTLNTLRTGVCDPPSTWAHPSDHAEYCRQLDPFIASRYFAVEPVDDAALALPAALRAHADDPALVARICTDVTTTLVLGGFSAPLGWLDHAAGIEAAPEARWPPGGAGEPPSPRVDAGVGADAPVRASPLLGLDWGPRRYDLQLAVAAVYERHPERARGLWVCVRPDGARLLWAV